MNTETQKRIADLLGKALQNPTTIQAGDNKALLINVVGADQQDVEDARTLMNQVLAHLKTGTYVVLTNFELEFEVLDPTPGSMTLFFTEDLDDQDHKDLAEVLDVFFDELPHKAGYDFVKTERIDIAEQE